MSLVAVAGDTYNAYFDFSSRPSAADDPLRGNLPDPNGDQALLDNAFNPCFIKPVVWPDETHAAWHYDFAAAVGEPRSTVAGRAQDFASAHKHPNMPLLDNDHWVVHVISGYKLSDVMVLGTLDQYDNDPDTNLASTGLTYATGQYATFLWEEIERDVASEHGWSAAQSQRNRALTLIHEVGHWLVPGTGHNYGPNPTDIMWVAQYNTAPRCFVWVEAGGTVPQTPWDFSLSANRQTGDDRGGRPAWASRRAGRIGPESALGLRPRRALSSAQVAASIRGAAGARQADA